MKNVLQKLLKVQLELKAPKNQYNEFGHFYYRSCEDILEGTKPLCEKYNCLILLTDNIKMVGDRIYVEATATFFDIDSEECIVSVACAREEDKKDKMDRSQTTGSASSYARKYALNGLFCIDDGKDADSLPPVNDGKDAGQKNNKKAEGVTAKQIADLQALAKKKGVTVETIVNGYKLKTLQDISPQQWAQAMNALQKREDVS